MSNDKEESCKSGSQDGKQCTVCDVIESTEGHSTSTQPCMKALDALLRKDKDELASMVLYLIEEVDKAHRRLEIDHTFLWKKDGEFVREDIPLEKRTFDFDGITCRDVTIACLKGDVIELNDALGKSVKLLKELGVDVEIFGEVLEEYDDDDIIDKPEDCH